MFENQKIALFKTYVYYKYSTTKFQEKKNILFLDRHPGTAKLPDAYCTLHGDIGGFSAWGPGDWWQEYDGGGGGEVKIVKSLVQI